MSVVRRKGGDGAVRRARRGLPASTDILFGALLALLLPGLLGLPALAASTDWRTSVSALAGTTPGTSAAASLYAVGPALGSTESDQRLVAIADVLRADADERFLGTGDRVRSADDLRLLALDEVKGSTLLAAAATTSGAAQAGRVRALTSVVSAAITTGRTAYADALRVTKVTSRRMVAPVSADVDRSTDVTKAADSEIARLSTGARGAPTAVALGVANAHLALMDLALRGGRPTAAIIHATVAYYWSVAAMESVGVKPFSATSDADGDALPDPLELVLRTDPRLADTDRDGLSDGYEAAYVLGFADPTKADSDGNGVRDDAEDFDQDGLTTAREAQLGSNPLLADSDADTLPDAEELKAGTKITVADTDGDGLLDGLEVRSGLNPLAVDSDGDGTPDGAQVVDQAVLTGSQVGLTVRAKGDLASSVTVTPAALGSQERTFGAIGDAVELSLPPTRRGDLKQARLTLPYPATLPTGTQPGDLRVFTFDETTNRWQPAGAELALDTQRRTVSVTITHFSRYAIFDITNWQQQWSGVASSCTPGDNPRPADVALVIDSSGSMSTNDPQNLRRSAAIQFVQALKGDDRASVVDFDDVAVVRAALTSDKAALTTAINQIDALGGTDIAAGVSAGLGTLPQPTDARVNALILLTDGQGSWNDTLITRAVAQKTPIFTIGLGAGVDATLLRRIASQTQGQYYGVSTADQLPQVFRSVAGCVNDPKPGTGTADPNCQSVDTDKDGLADCVETGGLALGNGNVVTTNPANPDTDGDGLPDGQEVGAASTVTGTVSAFSASSDPTTSDTDGDGLSDTEEFDERTSSWTRDTDGDGLDDQGEQENGTDPRSVDTDGDSLTDGYEVQHVDDEGISPLIRDERVGKLEYIKFFVQGAICGDVTWSWIGCGDNPSIARLAGNVIGSFIPLIDLRDALAGLIKGDLVGLGLSLVGLIPVIGDAAGVLGKVGKYVRKFPTKLGDAGRWVAGSGVLAGPVKRTVLRGLLPSFRALEAFGYAADDLVKIANTSSLDDLAKAVDASVKNGAVKMAWASRVGVRPANRVAEERVQQLVMPRLEPGWTPTGNVRVRRYEIDPATGRQVYYREHDLTYSSGTKAIEVKSGQVTRRNRGTDVCEQARRDRDLLDRGVLVEKVWHFVPSASRDRSGNDVWGAGPDAVVLGCLQQYRIPFIVHIVG